MKNKNTRAKHKGLSVWQLVMMAIGTVIGASFFLGSSVAIRAAGPSILFAFIFGAVLVYFILFALSEMTVSNPTPGNFRTYATEAYGPGMGFVVGWVYWTGMTLGMSSEATAVSILIRGWFPNVPILLLGSIIIIGVTFLNLLGADKLSKLEGGLSIIKILAITAFIIFAVLLIAGFMPGIPALGTGELTREAFAPGGIGGIAGSMLIVMFSYAGFEVLGLASSEAENPQETVPKAINYTVISLVILYVAYIGMLLVLIPTAHLNENISPMVAALIRWGMGWAGTVMNAVLITAILSTMLASVFGIGRMMRSLADNGQAPGWLKENSEVPYRGILFSGLAMLIGLGFGFLFPRVYLFLVSAGGFSAIFTYAVIVASHIRFRKKNGCPEGKCKVRGYPYSSLFVLISLIVVIFSMPLISGQSYGFFAGIGLTAIYVLVYQIMRFRSREIKDSIEDYLNSKKFQTRVSLEFSEELAAQKEIEKQKTTSEDNDEEQK